MTGENIERYTSPHGDQYAAKQTFSRGQTIQVQALPQVVVPVDQLFGVDE